MKFSEIDWSILRGALILLVISLLIAGGALSASYRFWNEKATVLKRASSALSSARGQYQALDDEEDIIAAYLPRYASLEEEGIIGRERRLDWIDALRETARSVQIPRLNYTIDAQRVFDVGLKLALADYEVYSSDVRLTLGLLHEGDLLRFLTKLRGNAPGLFGVTGCEIQRAGETLSNQARTANVSATCVLKFITIRGQDQPSGARS